MSGTECNGEISRRDRIHRVLSKMIGRPVANQSVGLAEMLGALSAGMPSAPDFERLPNPPAYGDLKDTLSAMKKSKRDTFNALEQSLHISFKKGFHKVLDSNIDVPENREVSTYNIISAIGVTEVYLRSSVMMLLALDKEIERQESILRTYYDQKGSGRRRNVYAYKVADELAVFYRKATREFPGYGMTNGYPTGPYMIALEQLFEILEIEAKIEGPAKAACEAVREQGEIEQLDPNPPLSGPFGFPFA